MVDYLVGKITDFVMRFCKKITQVIFCCPKFGFQIAGIGQTYTFSQEEIGTGLLDDKDMAERLYLDPNEPRHVLEKKYCGYMYERAAINNPILDSYISGLIIHKKWAAYTKSKSTKYVNNNITVRPKFLILYNSQPWDFAENDVCNLDKATFTVRQSFINKHGLRYNVVKDIDVFCSGKRETLKIIKYKNDTIYTESETESESETVSEVISDSESETVSDGY